MDLLVFGCLLLLFGLYLKKFPPDYNTQRHLGYRTLRSLQNENTWVKGNQSAAKNMIIFGLINTIIGLATLTFFANVDALNHISVLLIPVTIVLIFFIVEKQLAK